jgi:hypothetical protein
MVPATVEIVDISIIIGFMLIAIILNHFHSGE